MITREAEKRLRKQLKLAKKGNVIAVNALKALGVSTLDSSKVIKELTESLNRTASLPIDNTFDKCKELLKMERVYRHDIGKRT